MKKGAKLVVTDILLAPPGPDAPLSEAAIAEAMRTDYGPWPELWIDADRSQRMRAQRASTSNSRATSRATLPSYRMTAPRAWDGTHAAPKPGR